MNIADLKISRSRRRTVSIHVSSEGDVEIHAPHLMPSIFIKKFVEKHKDWIEKKVAEAKKTLRPKRKYIDGEEFSFLGKKYKLNIGNYTKIETKEEKLYLPISLKFRAKKELENWFVKQARVMINEQVKNYSEKMGTEFVSVRLSDTRSKWGSCTHDNRLQFNWRLIMAPILVLRYVIIHELAHTKEKNHSRRFWDLVASQNPSYREQRKWLKKFGNTLWV